MESSSIESIRKPLEVVQRLFEAHHANQRDLSGDWGVQAHFQSIFERHYSEIPLLTSKSFSTILPNTLVRYRCMVQDVFDPEYFLGIYEQLQKGQPTLQHGRYQDVIVSEDVSSLVLNGPRSETFERLPLYCVPIPGENSWVLNHIPSRRMDTSSSVNSKKRGRDNREEGEEVVADGEDSMVVDHDEPASNTFSQNNENEYAKKPKTGKNSAKENKTASTLYLQDKNTPFRDEDAPVVLVKAYHSDSWKVNTLIEFVGVLGPLDSTYSPQEADDEEIFMGGLDELKAHQPPASLVPRFHAFYHRELGEGHPIVHSLTSHHINDLKTHLSETRAHLVEYISAILGGDRLAAEYILLGLLSRVFGRAGILPLGSLPVNLSRIDPNNGDIALEIAKKLREVVPKSVYIPLAIDFLNNPSNRFVPRKDYQQNRLVSGMLQLPEGTLVFIDETRLSEGQLSALGLNNLKSIAKYVNWQRLGYEFEFFQSDFDSNNQFLIFSHGTSLFLKDESMCIQVPHQPSQKVNPSMIAAAEDVLTKFRTFLGVLRHLQIKPLGEALMKTIQDDFVTIRAQDSRVNGDMLNQWLTLQRLQSISFGEEEPTVERWNYMKSRESDRLARIFQK